MSGSLDSVANRESHRLLNTYYYEVCYIATRATVIWGRGGSRLRTSCYGYV